MGGAAASASTGGGGPNLRMLWSKLNWWGARVSPDGKRVAFIDMATANLWVRDVATGTDRNLTNTPKEKAWVDFPLYFSWSRDGTRLVYDWYADGGNITEIRVVDVASGAIMKFDSTRTVNSGRSNAVGRQLAGRLVARRFAHPGDHRPVERSVPAGLAVGKGRDGQRTEGRAR